MRYVLFMDTYKGRRGTEKKKQSTKSNKQNPTRFRAVVALGQGRKFI